MTKLSSTTFALVLKGEKQALAIGNYQDVQATLKAGIYPTAWARQATLAEKESCTLLPVYLEGQVEAELYAQVHYLGLDVNTPEPGEHTINGHDLNDMADEHERFLGVDARSPYGEQPVLEPEGGLVEGERKWDGDEGVSSQEYIEAAADMGDPVALFALRVQAERERVRLDLLSAQTAKTALPNAWLPKLYTATKRMVERVKALANLSMGEDQA